MAERFLRCDYCGGTYSADREWCPHCMAPRPKGFETASSSAASNQGDTTFYSDNVMYLNIG